MKNSKHKVTNTIADAAPATNWAHFRKNACCGKGGKTTNAKMIEKEND